jgi:hypothetical protein
MSTVVFSGVTLKNWQTPKKLLTRATKETELLSENIHVSRSSKVAQFPKIFQCYADTSEEMATVETLIDEDYSTLAIDGTDYSNCYVYQIYEIWEVSEGSGTWAYSIEFRQADVYD